MTRPRLDEAGEGTQEEYGNFRGGLFTTAVEISSRGRDGAPFSKKVMYLRLLPRYGSSGKSTGWYMEATLFGGRVVDYPLNEYADYSFNKERGVGAFTSRGQEFSITAIEYLGDSEDPQQETGDVPNE